MRQVCSALGYTSRKLIFGGYVEMLSQQLVIFFFIFYLLGEFYVNSFYESLKKKLLLLKECLKGIINSHKSKKGKQTNDKMKKDNKMLYTLMHRKLDN